MDSSKEILDFLYEDELMNVLTINYFENCKEDIGDVYLSYDNDKLESLIHVKYDGNSHFTCFYAPSTKALEVVSEKIKKIHHKDLLLAGKTNDIKYIMNQLGVKKELHKDSYYYLDRRISSQEKTSYRQAEEADFNFVYESLISFFNTKDEKSKEEIKNKLNLSKYRVLELENVAIGIGSFYGYSQKYTDITAVYINENYRKKGYGKELINHMIKEADGLGKIPVLQVSESNQAAIKTYIGCGFKKKCDYSFQFINA